ncbi:hypothetical protein [Dickeya sp. ws52]|uniref:hypothetical protein n=1 Tax=Dickeya sp. ws52 TaxID=2576377 RepID=UPI0018FEB51C|nr:hypothetical protein [Dickeya sp. ws52]
MIIPKFNYPTFSHYLPHSSLCLLTKISNGSPSKNKLLAVDDHRQALASTARYSAPERNQTFTIAVLGFRSTFPAVNRRFRNTDFPGQFVQRHTGASDISNHPKPVNAKGSDQRQSAPPNARVREGNGRVVHNFRPPRKSETVFHSFLPPGATAFFRIIFAFRAPDKISISTFH